MILPLAYTIECCKINPNIDKQPFNSRPGLIILQSQTPLTQPGMESYMNAVVEITAVDHEAIRRQAERVACPPVISAVERETLLARIKQLLIEQDAVLVAHYYTDADLQLTGG